MFIEHRLLGHQCSKNVQLFVVLVFSGRNDLLCPEEKLPECTVTTSTTVTTSKKKNTTNMIFRF